MSIGSMISGGIRLVRTQPQTVSIWAALYFAAIIVMMVAMRPFYGEIALIQQQAAANTAAGIRAAPPFDARFFGYIVVIDVVFLLVGIVAFAAVFRATIRPGGDRFAYLRVGMDELRLLGLIVLLIVAAIVLEIVAIIGGALLAALICAVVGRADITALSFVLVIGLVCAAIWAEVRISLAAPLTVMRGRIVIRDAWRATRGRFWELFGAYLLMSIAFMIVTVLFIAVTAPGLMAAYASFDQQALQAAAQAQLARQAAGLSIGMIVQAIVASIVFVSMTAVFIGAMTTAAIESDSFNESPATAA